MRNDRDGWVKPELGEEVQGPTVILRDAGTEVSRFMPGVGWEHQDNGTALLTISDTNIACLNGEHEAAYPFEAITARGRRYFDCKHCRVLYAEKP